MATGQVSVVEEEDDLLTCSICLETYKTPKYLPCLHTFCKVCIHTYILSSNTKHKHESEGFSCPVCRQFVSIGERSSNRECWAEELPNNHLIISMIDRQAIQKQEKLCNACELSNINQKAVSWCTVCQEALCSVCENCHRKFKMSSNHTIRTLQEIRTEKTASVSGLITCIDHSDKFVEIFCVDHCKPCCTVCATVKHRKCEKVLVIEDAADGIKEAKQTTELLEQIIQWKTMIDNSIQNTQKHICSVDLIGSNISSEIEKLKEDIIKRINKLEKDTKEELAIKKKGVVTELTDRMTEMSSLKSTVDNWHKILKTCINDGTDVQCLIEFNKFVPMKEKLETKINKATSNIENSSLSFKRNPIVERFSKSVTSFGEISTDTNQNVYGSSVHFDRDLVVAKFQEKIKSVGKTSIVNQNQNTMSETLCASPFAPVQNMSEVNARTGNVKKLFSLDAGENKKCSVSGMFTEDYIFVSNNKTKHIMKYGHTGILQCYIQLNHRCYDIDNCQGDEIAVTGLQEIILINMHTMTIGRKIKFTYELYGLRYLNINEQFVAACMNSIVWLNATNGGKIRETKTVGNETLFVCSYKNNTYAYGEGSNSVSCQEDCSIKFTYKNQKMSNPRGIDADCHGNLYVCSKGSNSIHQISPSGELMRIIPSEDLGTMDPWVIRFKQNSNKFLVTSLSSRKVVVAEIT